MADVPPRLTTIIRLMADTWEEMLAVMLREPKPPISAVCRDRHEGLTISVAHDGDESWRLDDGTRTYITDGTTTVLAEKGRITRFRDMHVYCMPLPQSMIHPRLWRNLGPATIIGRTDVDGRVSTIVSVPESHGRAAGELVVDDETGVIRSLQRLGGPDKSATLEELTIGAVIPPHTFTWPWEVDEEVRPTPPTA